MHNGKCYSPKNEHDNGKKQPPFESMYLPKNKTGHIPAWNPSFFKRVILVKCFQKNPYQLHWQKLKENYTPPW